VCSSDLTKVGTDSDWAAVSAGRRHTLAIKKDGSLWAWGYESAGVLGLGGYGRNVLLPIRVGADNDWAAVSNAAGHTAALKRDGSLWAWGDGRNGELGDGTYGYKLVPARVGTDNDWAALPLGSGLSVMAALKSDGSLWSRGWNKSGLLGLGDYTDRNVPTLVGPLPVGLGASVAISSIPKALFVGDAAQLRASADSRVAGDIEWSASHGHFSSAAGPSTTYTAPSSVPPGDGRATVAAAVPYMPSVGGEARVLIRSLAWTEFDGNSSTDPQLLGLAAAFGSTARADLDKYDVNGDGAIDNEDLSMLFKALGW
jgi:hypothetical protein